MAFPVLVRITHNGTVLPCALHSFGVEAAGEGQEFAHAVAGRDEFDGAGWVRRRSHTAVTVVMENGAYLPALYSAICRGEALDKVEFLWPQYREKENRERIYFTTVLYPVKLSGIRLYFPNVKDSRYERFSHLVRCDMRYRWIEWTYTKGTIWFKDEWIDYILETFHVKNERERRELERDLAKPALTDDLYDEMMAAEALKKIKLLYPSFEHADDARRSASPNEADEGDRVTLAVQTKALNDGAEVAFELFDTAEEKPVRIATVTGRNRNGVAQAEWDVDLSKCTSAEPKIEFEASAKGKKSVERGKVPVKKIIEDVWSILSWNGELIKNIKFSYFDKYKQKVNGKFDSKGKSELHNPPDGEFKILINLEQ
jgi:type VI secretion system Hcp family effector